MVDFTTLSSGRFNQFVDAESEISLPDSPHPADLLPVDSDDVIDVSGSTAISEVDPPIVIRGNTGFVLPDARDETFMVQKVGEDHYTITVTDGLGNETTYDLTQEELSRTIIDAGSGDDRIYVDPGVDVGVTILGGRGDDVIYGGSGDDQIHGGEGEDVIQGGGGADALFGGAGSDSIYAGADATVQTGDPSGADDGVEDIVVAHADAEVITGANDTVVEVTDQEIAAAEAWLAENGTVIGSAGFQARLTMDLAAMLTTNQGHGLVMDIANALGEGETLTFREVPTGETNRYSPDENMISMTGHMGIYDDGSLHAPLTVTFHEMIHALQFMQGNVPLGETVYENGAKIPNLEAAAVGLPWMAEPSEGETVGEIRRQPDPDQPYSTNQFRAELGISPRTSYGGGPALLLPGFDRPTGPIGEPVSWQPSANDNIFRAFLEGQES